ncbi:MAG: ATP-binding cassette domain-containing protein [Deltaproteobacteria bacterium]|nr:ATP-binding cassette domain-containing protein [Deltaproteobacteria bacterium]
MIKLTNISKTFGEVRALHKVNLNIYPGTIHGIIGENGAGKSTLMKILTGFIRRSSGNVIYQSKNINLQSPRDAREIGIGMLYQEPLDFPLLTVLDNFMTGGSSFPPSRQRANLSRLCSDFGFDLDPDCRVNQITVGERQQLELLRLIQQGTKILILDEPTSGISEKQQDLLFTALRNLKAGGTAILLVSHKLDEIELLCDDVTVLRHGEVTAYWKRPFDRDAMLLAMFDTVPESKPTAVNYTAVEPVLDFHKVSSGKGRSGLNSVSTTIRAGEVVGLAGVDGSGQSVFLQLAFGLLQPDSGRISRSRESVSPAFLPADRLAEGLVPGLTIREHQILSSNIGPVITSKSGLAKTRRAIKSYNIVGSPETAVKDLSGGNLQRLLLSLIPNDVQLILMENPTRGLDLQSASWTWEQLHNRITPDGTIIFASPDLEELLQQSSRILTFYNGSITLDTPAHATNYRQLSRAVTGEKDPAI